MNNADNCCLVHQRDIVFQTCCQTSTTSHPIYQARCFINIKGIHGKFSTQLGREIDAMARIYSTGHRKKLGKRRCNPHLSGWCLLLPLSENSSLASGGKYDISVLHVHFNLMFLKLSTVKNISCRRSNLKIILRSTSTIESLVSIRQ